mmetsp:Transcript_28884/g.55041  ORF Transcript_28884/g.55041 Transcript_28884/m.55041 type:complete len:542 (-) Transcript_28884:1473-3098(-)|eukprot:CAMPEP_0184416538 /NCGR_PEP_ID=MMETSP0738-20130409/9554_1 /TAXON_ID=385413 /ORGANISM="Thalassiosira miniscula, Strain CCMP1093" /LENGTH=541 /DNA_ID=CAMNT_0026776001 /DNA_START=888 /DNA_END=2513 /DNA_ORIENTATION=-
MKVPFLAGAIAATLIGPAYAQDKISSDLERIQIVDGSAAYRVMVVMRQPKPGLSPSAAFASPAGYLAGTLDEDALTTRSIADLPVAVAEVTEEGLSKLTDDPNVAMVLPDLPIALPDFDVELSVSDSEALNAVTNSSGAGTMIAVLDTGTDLDHPAFQGKNIVEACFSTNSSNVYRVESLCPNQTPISTIAGAGRDCDENINGCNHGTHVASIALGNSNRLKGVAPDADLMSIQVFTKFDDPGVCGQRRPCVRSFPSDQIEALNFVFDNLDNYNIASINMSIGGGRHLTSCDATSPLASIVTRLAARGVPSAIASGNDGFFNAVASPGCISTAITVTATNASGQIDISYANMSGDVDIAARGTRVFGALPNGRYGRLTGTSMATPSVAGLLAVLTGIRPEITISEVNRTINLAGDLVTDPRTNVAVPEYDLAGSIQLVEEMNVQSVAAVQPLPQSAEDLSFLNSRAISITPQDSTFSPETLENLARIFPRAIISADRSNSVTIEDFGGFTPQSIEGIRDLIGPDALISDETLSTTFPQLSK